ncbi:MAG: hypothetical protein SVP26_02620 [Chloroflexota bacterium]|nr:hypothetical protein [Chloroflexota bacterium]
MLVDPNRGVLGIQGKDIPEVIGYFDKVRELAKQLSDVDLDKEARFYEVAADLAIATDISPLEVTANLFAGASDLQRLGNLLGAAICNYGVRLVPANQAPTGEEWFDYRIEPLLARPSSEYFSSIVHRSRDRDSVVTAAGKLSETIKALVGAMEGGAEP